MTPRVFAVLPLVLLACLGTEGGNPPIEPTLDEERVFMLALSATMIDLTGDPGAASPPGARLRYIDLEGTTGFEELMVGPDGEFRTAIAADSSHRFRLRVLAGEERSDPVDVQPVAATGPGSAPCLAYETDLLLGDERQWEVENTCDESVELLGGVFRLGTGAVDFEGRATGALAPGERVSIDLVRRAAFDEELFVLNSDDGPAAVTLRTP